MKTSVLSVIALGGLFNTAFASPVHPRDMSVCNAISQRQCCDVGVDGIINLTCAAPSRTPTDMKDFSELCSENGQQAACCVLPFVSILRPTFEGRRANCLHSLGMDLCAGNHRRDQARSLRR
ncbi:uncharacterized protein LY89DRAFT_639705 [Mollisia scopiformis]|uniref:Hydrophobin n=1 Tax=Mollisia scopiformis TaxID=149040 RepID=A0A194XJG9_MOLSC|nr:uncharacterized protein LY89DRAFT_639705 [Mollisia scopiformis]KUJ20298.1 hypothetical protein LY89DRAFT_639705 [Mollisia scopiformis]